MRYILILLLVLVYVVYKIIARCRVKEGADFCIQATEYLEIYKEYTEMAQKTRFTYEGKYFKAECDRNNLRNFYEQMELGFAYLEDQYEVIKPFEWDFTEEDWNYVEELHQKLLDANSNIRYEKWQNGFLKTQKR